MSWQVAERASVRKINPNLARRFVEMVPCPADRPMRNAILLTHEKAMLKKTFRGCEWCSAYCKENNLTYRVNGKHTSAAALRLFDTGSAPDFDVLVTHFECDTLKDVADLYATFDSKVSSRNQRDINVAFSASDPDLREINVNVRHMAVAAISLALWDSGSSRHSIIEKAELQLTYKDFVLWLAERNITHTNLFRSSVVAAMFLTYQKHRNGATIFWDEVKEENNPKNDAPSRVLAKWLIRTKISGTNSVKSQNCQVVTSRESLVRCIHAWNAYRNNEPTKMKYYADKPIPAVK